MPESLDLHGMTREKAREAFIEFYNGSVLGSTGRAVRFEVVHGYGSSGVGGVLRSWLRGFLDRHSTYLEYQSGEHIDGNQGHTFVTAMKLLPSAGEDLAEEICAYCDTPRAQSKIIGKFRRHGEAEVLRLIKLLEKQKRLKPLARGTVRLYLATLLA
jgi:hypothetical protein